MTHLKLATVSKGGKIIYWIRRNKLQVSRDLAGEEENLPQASSDPGKAENQGDQIVSLAFPFEVLSKKPHPVRYLLDFSRK